ncbi:hypothetical protein [Sulfitobacter sp.]|uniref:hypothetical protein n=1 Tax=Sulfitobacter sp. TaxID=1903071 RepID=UPI0030021AE0
MQQNRITIRNIDDAILAEARAIVRYNAQETMGAFMSSALEAYIMSLPYEADDYFIDAID